MSYCMPIAGLSESAELPVMVMDSILPKQRLKTKIPASHPQAHMVSQCHDRCETFAMVGIDRSQRPLLRGTEVRVVSLKPDDVGQLEMELVATDRR